MTTTAPPTVTVALIVERNAGSDDRLGTCDGLAGVVVIDGPRDRERAEKAADFLGGVVVLVHGCRDYSAPAKAGT